MQSDAERTLNNLQVIGVLSHNDKLLTNGDCFDIYAPTTFRSMMRKVYGEGRAQNVSRVRHAVREGIAFVSKSLEDANALLQQSSSGDASHMRLRVETIVLQHVRMRTAVRKAADGLSNLLQTYRDDAALVSQIQLVVDEIRDFERVIRPHSEAMQERCGSVFKSTPSSSPPSHPVASPVPSPIPSLPAASEEGSEV